MKHAPHALVSRYARALFKVAVEKNAVENVRADLAEIQLTLDSHAEFAAILMNPSVTAIRVKKLLEALAAKLNAHELTSRFVKLLVDKDRLDILRSISPVFEQLCRDHLGQIDVHVTTAVPVSEAIQQQILTHLAKRSGKKPLVSWATDPALLGGIIVHWPDRVFDGSVVRKIAALKAHMAGTA